MNKNIKNPEEVLIHSAVIVPVYRSREGKLRIIVIKRSDGGIHGGHLAFPGGKVDQGDASSLAAALRETEEEIGIKVNREDVLAALPVVDTISTGFRIFPFLAKIVPPAEWQIDSREVAEVFDLDVAELVQPENMAEEVIHFEPWDGPRQVSFYKVDSHRLWGASYRILSPLVPRLMAEEWSV